MLFRKCSACHTLGPDSANKAGPTLHGIFGRRAGSVPGYKYSDALKESELVWNEKTIGNLFKLGPDDFTPGSKMPLQDRQSTRLTPVTNVHIVCRLLLEHTKKKTSR